MSVLQTRGGWPHVFRAGIDTTGRKHDFKMVSTYLKVVAVTNPAKMYFTEADFTADTNYVSIPVAAAATPWGWEGPAEVPGVWLKGDGGTSAVELVAFQRRG